MSPRTPQSMPPAAAAPVASGVLRRALLRWIPGMALLFAAAMMAQLYYAPVPAENPPKKLPGNWLKTEWLTLSEDEMRDAMMTGSPDPWRQMLVRTALVRWRLRAVSPEPFNNLMARWARGWWTIPDRAAWERALADTDTAWLNARRRALDRREALADLELPEGPPPEHDLIIVRLGDRVRTVDVGTIVRFVVESPPRDWPAGPPFIFWETDRAPEQSVWRRRLGLVRPTGQSDRFIIEVDLSAEPGWLAQGAKPLSLRISYPGLATWRVRRVEFGDSPLLDPRS